MTYPGPVDELRLIGVAGSNKIMGGELSRLTRRASVAQRLGPPRKEGTGSLVYPFDPGIAAVAVLYHRTSIRIFRDLYRSRAERLEPLYDDLLGVMREPSPAWPPGDFSISVSAHGVRDFAAGERQIVGTVKNALVDGARRRSCTVTVDPERPDVHVAARLSEGVVSVSIDLAGRPMNQRGYRGSGGKAPLRENVAAMLVMLGRHDPRSEALLDPMAGSGTIAIEAACLADARPVWVPPRRPAICELPGVAEAAAALNGPLFADTRAFVLANDVDPAMARVCETNAASAGVSGAVACRQGDFRKITPDEVEAHCRRRGMDPSRGLILSNPPYGERIGDADLLGLYRDLGRWCRRFPGWRAGFLTVNREFERAFGGEPRIKKPMSNGPLRGYFLLYDL